MDKQTIDMMHGHKWPETSKDGTCYLCGLRTASSHEDPLHCIEELRVALLKERTASESLAIDISSRLLAVIEELAAHPECGFSGYVTYNPQTGNKEQLPPQYVAGILANIRHRYEQLGDWSPMKVLREQLAAADEDIRKLTSLLEGRLTSEGAGQPERSPSHS